MSDSFHDVAIIGAGISGLAAARRLQEGGLKVVVVEKSRGVGGRAATRRIKIAPEIEISVDHGAQFFTVRDPRFQEQVARWQEEGLCFPWCDGFYRWSDGVLHSPDPELREMRYACRAGMTSLGKELAKGVEVIREFLVNSVALSEGVWQLHAEAHPASPIVAKSLIVSAPLPQAMKLTRDYLSSEERGMLIRVVARPCIAVMAQYDENLPAPPWKGIQIQDPSSKLSWMAWDSSRRKSDALGKVAVLHGSKNFSSQWLEASSEELKNAGIELLQEALPMVGEWIGKPSSMTVHRWRYARQEGPSVPEGYLRSSLESSLYLIGDGVNGGRLEGAWLSGLFAAENYLCRQVNRSA